jgi:hypothetical protein
MIGRVQKYKINDITEVGHYYLYYACCYYSSIINIIIIRPLSHTQHNTD